MIFAALLICWEAGCQPIPDSASPHTTHAQCAARLHVLKGAAAAAYPGARIRAVCGTLDEVRRATGAYQGEFAA